MVYLFSIFNTQLSKQTLSPLFSYPILIIATLFLSINIVVADTSEILEIKPLAPLAKHQRVVQIVSASVKQNHYKKMQLDDSLSTQVFKNYIKSLDYNRSYFLASDIEEFKTNRYEFDRFITTGNVELAFKMFNRFQERLDTRLHFIFKQIDTPFDFTKDEFYVPNRDSLAWANSDADLDSYWRKRIKNEYLSLKISGKEEKEIKKVLHKRYTNLKRRFSQNQSEDVIQVYLNAFLETYDPHTSYFSPKASEDFNIRMQQSLEGIGARLSPYNEYTKVFEVIKGGPADKNGFIKKDDLIVGVGQDSTGEMVDVIGWRLDDVVQLIRGPKGSTVRLQIIHDENDMLADADVVTITRDKVKLEDSAAKGDTLHIMRNGKKMVLGKIEIPAFYFDYKAYRKRDPNYKSTTRDVKKILLDFKKQNVDGVIVDLRNNGGGFLSESITLTGLFIKQGPVVQIRDHGNKVDVEKDSDSAIYWDGPLTVLVNQFSASASEIFAAAIQDYGRGIVVGNQTFGKGTVQNIVDLNRFFPRSKEKYGQIKLTMAKFYRVNGGSTQHVGVVPDIELPTFYKHDEVGESARKNALLWDKINPIFFKNNVKRVSQLLPSLKINHMARVENDSAYAHFIGQINKYKEEKGKKSYSLNEKVRVAERKKRKETEKKNKKYDDNDVIFDESKQILADYVLLSKRK